MIGIIRRLMKPIRDCKSLRYGYGDILGIERFEKIEENIPKDKRIGGWVLHEEIVLLAKSTFDISCHVCDRKFKSTPAKKKNVSLSEKYIFEDSDGKYVDGVWCTWHKYSKVILVESVCPNCGNENEIGCQRIKEIENIWETRDSDFDL